MKVSTETLLAGCAVVVSLLSVCFSLYVYLYS